MQALQPRLWQLGVRKSGPRPSMCRPGPVNLCHSGRAPAAGLTFEMEGTMTMQAPASITTLHRRLEEAEQ